MSLRDVLLFYLVNTAAIITAAFIVIKVFMENIVHVHRIDLEEEEPTKEEMEEDDDER